MNPFEGLSSLHPKEEAPAGPSQKQLDLQAYLESNYGSTSGTKKKKKKKAKARATSSLRIVDNDLTGFAAVEETIKVKEVGKSRDGIPWTMTRERADPDGPVVVNPSEAAAFERSQQKVCVHHLCRIRPFSPSCSAEGKRKTWRLAYGCVS